MFYVKKPIPVEATQFNSYADVAAVKKAYFSPDGKIRWVEGDPGEINISNCRQGFYIPTLEGGHEVTPGDWIITGVRGEQYPCKDEIFRETYELAPEIL